jgi:protein SCO1/2
MRSWLALILGHVRAIAFLAAAMAWLPLPARAEETGPARIGGGFELTDQDGRRVTEKDLLGKPSVIFFGFTSCPDVCPTTLTEITHWLKALGSDADKLNVAFISVDSARDTPEHLKLYLRSFAWLRPSRLLLMKSAALI